MEEEWEGWLESSQNFEFIPNDGTDDAGICMVTVNCTHNYSEF